MHFLGWERFIVHFPCICRVFALIFLGYYLLYICQETKCTYFNKCDLGPLPLAIFTAYYAFSLGAEPRNELR